jgi:NAD(P)H-dependent FMN reductase
MYNLGIMITSSRPGRKGPLIADWIFEAAKNHPGFNTKILDLGEINLPFMDELYQPIMRKYEHQHTKDWSKMVDETDAFVIVTPEYNHGFTAVFKNAIDYLHQEWKYKPVGLVSYGGGAAGTRAVQMMKPVLSALSMTPLSEAVSIPFFTKLINEEGKFMPDEHLNRSADTMFKSLLKWTETLKQMRP